jgi:exopolyphosphatase
MMQPSLLSNYLRQARHMLRSPQSIFVIGNESADCDSIVSAISYAYLSKNPFMVPVVNNKKEVVLLRSEVREALSFAGITLEELIYFDEIVDRTESLNFVLVDHNEPSALWARMGLRYKVSGIVDHHVDGGLFKDTNPRIIKSCASCCSLVIDQFKEEPIPEDIGKMVLTALTFDTVNWTYRVTDFDIHMARIICNDDRLSADDLHMKCQEIQTLFEKNIISESTVDPLVLMHKDYKLYQKGDCFYGISVIHIDLTSVEQLETVMRETMKRDNIQLHIILSAVRPAGQYSFYQQLSICCLNGDLMSRILNVLIDGIKLVPLSAVPGNTEFAAFDLLDLSMARKQIQPLVHSMV